MGFRMIHTVFFDIGGTLVEGKSSLVVLAEKLGGTNQADILKFMIDRFMLRYNDENCSPFYSIKELLVICAREAAQKYGFPDLSGEVAELYRENHLNNGTLYEDALPVLMRLRERNIKMILASDADADVLLEQLEKLDILRYFAGLVISSNAKGYKPSDAVVREAAKFCREPYSGILFVGDARVDMLTARKLGVRSVLINRSGDFKYDADYKITNLRAIFEIISLSQNSHGKDNFQ
jgi:FMN phosphatase YigB (HAD superfamily)